MARVRSKQGGIVGAFVACVVLAACATDRNSSEPEAVGEVSSAVWTNGGFETGAAGAAPTGWTVNTFLNNGITVQTPQTYAGLNLAAGGKNLTTTIEGRQRFPVRVRYARDFRDDVDRVGNVLVSGVGGAQIPLRDISTIRTVMGPSMISSENGLLRGTVLMNVRGRDVGRFVDEARKVVAEQVQMPSGYFIEWSGQFENEVRARKRLEIVVPIVVLVIFVLLYRTYDSAKEAAHVLLAVPFALTGGVFLVKALGYNFSVAVWVGFIALFGTAVQTGVVMVIYLEEAVARRVASDGRLTLDGLHAAIIEGALLRLRPKVMTVATVVAGLLPLLWSTRTGAEFMKPLAAPVLGGMVSSLLHVLVVTPVIFAWIREREINHATAS